MDEIKEEKARAYDLLAMIQQAQQQLEQVNNQIRELGQKSKAETVETG